MVEDGGRGGGGGGGGGSAYFELLLEAVEGEVNYEEGRGNEGKDKGRIEGEVAVDVLDQD